MSYMQWLIEARALSRREKEERERQSELITEVYKAAARTLRETLVHWSGTNIGAGKPKKEGDPTPSLPLITTLGRGEVIEELLKRESEGEAQKEVLDDEALDKFNEDLMNIDMGDLEPVFTGQNSQDPFERWMSQDNVELMKAMGVELHHGELDLSQEKPV